MLDFRGALRKGTVDCLDYTAKPREQDLKFCRDDQVRADGQECPSYVETKKAPGSERVPGGRRTARYFPGASFCFEKGVVNIRVDTHPVDSNAPVMIVPTIPLVGHATGNSFLDDRLYRSTLRYRGHSGSFNLKSIFVGSDRTIFFSVTVGCHDRLTLLDGSSALGRKFDELREFNNHLVLLAREDK
jgi:hypothetical protein